MAPGTIVDEADEQTVPYGSNYITPRGTRCRIDFALPPAS
jgi:hypothetical protein